MVPGALFILISVENVTGQVDKTGIIAEGINSDTSISWYSTIPSGEKRRANNLLQRVGNLVLGEKPPLLSRPVAVTVIDSSMIWIADQGYGEIVFTGEGEKANSPFFSNREARLPSITSICNIPGQKVLFTDSRTNCLYIKSRQNNYILLNDNLSLLRPTGVAWSDKAGEIWVIETGAHRLKVLNAEGELLRIIGSRGTGNGEFNYPTHIWIDKSGLVYIVDAMNFRVQVFDSNGEFIFSFGEQGDATGYFARPKGIATDSKGYIYVADALFNSIQVFDRSGQFLHHFGNQGTGKGEFWMPNGIFIDKNDFLYIADSYNSRIQVYKIDHK